MRERGREGAKGKSINSVQPSTARARKCTLLVKQLTQGTARGHFRHRTDRGEGGGLGLDGTRVAERKISKGQTFSPSPLKVRIESERAIAIEGRASGRAKHSCRGPTGALRGRRGDLGALARHRHRCSLSVRRKRSAMLERRGGSVWEWKSQTE